MALTVNAAFEKFNKNIVNIDIDKTKQARNSRDWLIEQLKTLPSKINDFPRLYDEKHIKLVGWDSIPPF